MRVACRPFFAVTSPRRPSFFCRVILFELHTAHINYELFLICDISPVRGLPYNPGRNGRAVQARQNMATATVFYSIKSKGNYLSLNMATATAFYLITLK